MADDEPDAGATCKNFLLASPPGQSQDVLADLRSLAPSVLDAPGLVDDASRVFNVANARIASCGDDAHPVVLVAEGAVGGGHFVDVKTGDVVKVDHLAMTAAADAGAPPAPPAGADDAEALRGALAKEMDEYVRAHFQSTGAAAAVFARPGAAELKVVVTAERLNLKNFWSGNWVGNWTVALAGGSATVSGEVKVRAHYFEDGNVQLMTRRAFAPASVPATAAAVRDAIVAAESSLQAGLEEMYGNMSDETFKSMRRTMPITRTKMNWSLSDVKLKQNLRS